MGDSTPGNKTIWVVVLRLIRFWGRNCCFCPSSSSERIMCTYCFCCSWNTPPRWSRVRHFLSREQQTMISFVSSRPFSQSSLAFPPSSSSCSRGVGRSRCRSRIDTSFFSLHSFHLLKEKSSRHPSLTTTSSSTWRENYCSIVSLSLSLSMLLYLKHKTDDRW